VWFLPADRSAARKITSDVSRYEQPTVTADGRNIAVGRLESTANIWLVPADDPAAARPLTTGLGNRNGMGGVQFLPEGSVLFTAPESGIPTLHVVGREGGDGRAMLHGMTGWSPALSPDGKQIAFLSDRSGILEIWTCDRDGRNLQQITLNGRPVAAKARAGQAELGASASPSWFPDSRSLAFASMGNVQAAWKITPGTTNLERLTDAPANVPRVSPDGRSLLCRLRSTKLGVPLWRTALLPIGAKGETRYFDVPRYGGPPDARWFPDGSRFAFLDYAGGVANIWVQDLGGGEPRQLTKFDAGQICGYDISADAKFLAVSRCEWVNDLVLIRDFR
jgi:TolB protein